MRHTRLVRRITALLGIVALGLALCHVHPETDSITSPRGSATAARYLAGSLHATPASNSHAEQILDPDRAGHRLAAEGPLLVSDDDHHEHSSRRGLDIETCFTCRSQHDDDLAANVRDTRVPALWRDAIGSFHDGDAHLACSRGLPKSRAPPSLA